MMDVVKRRSMHYKWKRMHQLEESFVDDGNHKCFESLTY
jgi:hypothetical protein